MKKKTADKNEPRGEAGVRVGGILSGLTGLVEKLNELAETGGELRRGSDNVRAPLQAIVYLMEEPQPSRATPAPAAAVPPAAL